MKFVMFSVVGLSAFILLVLWMMTKISYRIGSTHLKILWFNMTVRKIDLLDIKRISKRRPRRSAEYWYNTTHPSHRMLAIQRHSGPRRYIVITPTNRYVFLADLQRAIQRLKPEIPIDSLVDASSEEAEP